MQCDAMRQELSVVISQHLVDSGHPTASPPPYAVCKHSPILYKTTCHSPRSSRQDKNGTIDAVVANEGRSQVLILTQWAAAARACQALPCNHPVGRLPQNTGTPLFFTILYYAVYDRCLPS